jgi:Arc/MetJ-type ribon-helix-helix transcriptional regulator
MNIRINQKTEDVLNDAIRSGQFASVEEFIEAMAKRWQAEQKSVPAFPDRIDINELAANHPVPPFSLNYQAPKGLWPEEETADEFIHFVREERMESRSGTNG